MSPEVKKLIDYLEKSGHKVSYNGNPSQEELDRIKGLTERQESFVDLMRKRMRSKLTAVKLLEDAYAKGDFDEIIKHLEEAKKLK